MPSNKTLIEEAKTIAAELEIDINTDGMKNDALVDLVSDLRAKKKDAETVTQADDQGGEPDETPAEDDQGGEPDGTLRVAKGRSVTTQRGILAEGKEIRAEDLSGGQSSLSKLIDKGVVEA